MNKRSKDFLSIQKDFFKSVGKDYLKPLRLIPSLIRTVFLFLTILVEMPYQMFKSLSISEEEHKILSDTQFKKEVEELEKSGLSGDTISSEL